MKVLSLTVNFVFLHLRTRSSRHGRYLAVVRQTVSHLRRALYPCEPPCILQRPNTQPVSTLQLLSLSRPDASSSLPSQHYPNRANLRLLRTTPTSRLLRLQSMRHFTLAFTPHNTSGRPVTAALNAADSPFVQSRTIRISRIYQLLMLIKISRLSQSENPNLHYQLKLGPL